MRRVIRMGQVLAGLAALFGAISGSADSRPAPPAAPLPSYADIADLADGAPLVIRAQPRKLVPVEPERARGVKPGRGRFYVEARTEAVVFGRSGLGEALRYLVDLPLDAKGKPPVFKKKSVVLFARPVASRPGELQLVASDGQLLWDPALDARLRTVIGELNTPGAPQRITGLREAIHVSGTLADEGETQLFFATANGEPAAASIARTPGQPVRIGVSFSELVGDSGTLPPKDTLGWYRLACFLPAALPQRAIVSTGAAERQAAARDYAALLARLGPCPRLRN